MSLICSFLVEQGSGRVPEESVNNVSHRLVSLGIEDIAAVQCRPCCNRGKSQEPILQFKETRVEMFFLPCCAQCFLQSWFVCKELAICCVRGAGEVHMSVCRRRNVDSQLHRTEFQNFLCLRSCLEPRRKGTNVVSGLFFRFMS